MSVKYLLPCRCGRQIGVETREAGETTVCPCGQSLLIPTMLEITRLEPAPVETSEPAQGAWGWQHSMIFLGGAMLVLAIAYGVYLRWNRPIASIDAIDPQTIQERANRLPPVWTWHYWQLMKQGLDRRVDQRFAERMSLYHIGQTTAAVAGLLGLALIAGGMAIEKRKRQRKPAAVTVHGPGEVSPS